MKNKEISLLVSGDFCPINRIEAKILSKSANDIFGELAPKIKNVDLSITNLECPLTKHSIPIKKTGPALKGVPEAATILSKAGFNLVTLANNHIMDYGEQGLKDTLEVLENNNINYVGASVDGNSAKVPFYFQKEGLKIAIVNVTENEWSTTDNQEAGANPINPIENFYQIQNAKKFADKVMLISHGGHELYNLPSPRMKELFRFYIDAGADIVINHHTHFISGYEVYKKAPIFYSLGNFIFDNPSYRKSKWNVGISLLLKISNDTIDFDIIPFDQCDQFAGIRVGDSTKMNQIMAEINELNEIINNDDELQQCFYIYTKKNNNKYTSYIEPHRNRYILALQNRHLLPRILSKRKKLLLLNLIRCESHREILIKILRDENRDTP